MVAVVLLSTGSAWAQVVVQPDQAGLGKTQTFTINVPTERDSPTVGLRLLLPSGLQEVAPFVKPGWQVVIKRNSAASDAAITEIDWLNGSIAAGFRDEFSFSAQLPTKPTTLVWKVYQTYQDKTVVSWDQTPKEGSHDATGTSGPYSATQIMNDLSPVVTAPSPSNNKIYGAYVLGAVAFIAGLMALLGKRRK